ncbi:bifunctional phosphoribosylaminoimidazolecarboxamide formyltransferase/IMP cyclohydrolase [Candidatus Omnitrophota bacterium]
MIQVKRALISVYDKEGIVELAGKLHEFGVEILSTGGTLALLKENNIPAQGVSSVTDFPEIMDGRVKTLHPTIHGGILGARDNEKHVRQMKENNISPIDLVIINLYPFEETIRKKSVTLPEAIEKIDIGGPTMLRAAAKNFRFVVSVCDRHDYARIFEEMSLYNGEIREETSLYLAQKVFATTSRYDYAIQSFLNSRITEDNDYFPETLLKCFVRKGDLRYGENPHQKAALYMEYEKASKDAFKKYHGKDLSFNNLQDVYAVIDILREFDKPVACVVKHNNPCGICENANLTKAIIGAIDSDPISAFGGIVGLNKKCGVDQAKAVLEKLRFFEIIIAPGFTKDALKLLRNRKNLRIIKIAKPFLNASKKGSFDIKFSDAGILVQDEDVSLQKQDASILKKISLPTKKKTTKKDLEELLFAWRCVKVVKSNAIVITKNKQTIGIGAGQMSRIGAMDIACRQAGTKAKGGFVASDAFFPMPDNIQRAAKAGIKAIIQPGGSVKDKDVIAMADKKAIAMVFTGKRHFKH